MALKKQKLIKGIPYEYWRIYRIDQNFNNDLTTVRLAPYYNKVARDENKENFSTEGLVAIEVNGIDLTRKEIYAKIKESRKSTKPNNWDVKFPDTEFIPEEMNFFVDAEDVLE